MNLGCEVRGGTGPKCFLLINRYSFAVSKPREAPQTRPAVCYTHYPQGGAQFTNNSLRKRFSSGLGGTQAKQISEYSLLGKRNSVSFS